MKHGVFHRRITIAFSGERLSDHHNPAGGFRNPWPNGAGQRSFADFLRWRFGRWKQTPPPRPGRAAFARAQPDVALPAAAPAELRITWVGHSTFLIQIGGHNILTDPQWSLRASPWQWIGPSRLNAPGLPFEALPRIDAVLLSHDHYDHLDDHTVRRIAAAHPDAPWYAPLGHAQYLRGLGLRGAHDLDWWQEAQVDGLTIQALPVQHWTRRLGSPVNARLWCSFSLRSSAHHVYFAGDSGYCPGFAEIAARVPPIDVAILPIGAYEPRWFMKAAHMNPEDAMRAFRDLGAEHFVAMHWGTFILTDEPALEPPARIRTGWDASGLPADRLHVLAFGETLRL